MPVPDEKNVTFSLLLGALGVALGIAATVSALTSDDFNGRVYLFLPAIILGVIGIAVGGLIDGAIHKGRIAAAQHRARSSGSGISGGTTPSSSPSLDIRPSAADELQKLADLLERGLITQQQFDTERDRLLG